MSDNYCGTHKRALDTFGVCEECEASVQALINALSAGNRRPILTEDRVREIVREEIAKLSFTVTGWMDRGAVEKALREGVERGAQCGAWRCT